MHAEHAAVLWMQAGAVEGGEKGLAEAIGLATGSLGILAFLGLLFALKASVIGLALWMDAAYPRASRLAYENYRMRGRRSFWIGLVNVVVGGLLILFLLATKVLAFLGILLALVAMLGYAAAFRHLGARLLKRDGESAHVLLTGGLAAETAFCFPVLGQVFMLGVLMRGIGAAVTAMFAARRAPVATEPVHGSAAEGPTA